MASLAGPVAVKVCSCRVSSGRYAPMPGRGVALRASRARARACGLVQATAAVNSTPSGAGTAVPGAAAGSDTACSRTGIGAGGSIPWATEARPDGAGSVWTSGGAGSPGTWNHSNHGLDTWGIPACRSGFVINMLFGIKLLHHHFDAQQPASAATWTASSWLNTDRAVFRGRATSGPTKSSGSTLPSGCGPSASRARRRPAKPDETWATSQAKELIPFEMRHERSQADGTQPTVSAVAVGSCDSRLLSSG